MRLGPWWPTGLSLSGLGCNVRRLGMTVPSRRRRSSPSPSSPPAWRAASGCSAERRGFRGPLGKFQECWRQVVNQPLLQLLSRAHWLSALLSDRADCRQRDGGVCRLEEHLSPAVFRPIRLQRADTRPSDADLHGQRRQAHLGAVRAV